LSFPCSKTDIFNKNILFRVHSYFFTRESIAFQELIRENPGQVPLGSSPSSPLFLPDVSPEDLSTFLWVFYNPKLSIYTAPFKEWMIILAFAVDWGFAEIEELALRELDNFPEFHERYDLFLAQQSDSLAAIHKHIEDDHGL
jgi:hypothetical protein